MCDAKTLISLIESRPAIYNYKMKEYSNKHIIEKLWTEIADEIQTTVPECKSKWKSLRISYARHLRDNPPNKSTMYKKKKEWHLAKNMSFLKDFMLVQRFPDMIAPEEDINEDRCSSIESPVNGAEDLDGPIIDCFAPSPTNYRKRKLSTSYEMADPEPMVSYLRTKLAKIENEDPHIAFFRSLLQDIKKLSERNQRKLKQDFISNLNKLLDEQDMLAPLTIEKTEFNM